jgi:hypothetical protein
MTSTVPSFCVSCIDFRFTSTNNPFFNAIGREYFDCSTAGAALANGYSEFCNKSCAGRGCDPENSMMTVLKNSVNDNLRIARTLRPITEIFFLNHQDCGAIKAFLACSGHPSTLGENNAKEIRIHTKLLKYAKRNMLSWAKTDAFPQTDVILGLVDINGTTAKYNTNRKIWTVSFVGEGTDPRGLWYGLTLGQEYKPF